MSYGPLRKSLALTQALHTGVKLRFERSAEYYFDLSRGIDHRQVHSNRERKSVGAEDTFSADIGTVDEARQLLSPLADKVWRVCEGRDLHPRTVTLKIKFSNFEQITRSKSLPRVLGKREDIIGLLEVLLGPEFPPRSPVRLLGVTLCGFDHAKTGIEQLTML